MAQNSQIRDVAVSPINLNVKMAKESSHQRLSDAQLAQKRAAKKKAGETMPLLPFYSPQPNVMAFGMSDKQYGLIDMLGFQSSYGTTTFYNCTIGAETYNWTYSEVDAMEEGNFIESEFAGYDLTVKNGVGQLMTPWLDAYDEAGASDSYTAYQAEFLCGGSASYWVGENEQYGTYGLTFYKNAGLKDPGGYSGTLTNLTTYQPGKLGFSAGGAYVNPQYAGNWENNLTNRLGTTITEDGDTIVTPATNVAVQNFTLRFPAPESTYTMTRAWMWANLSATDATQLTSYIYRVNEDGTIDEDYPIAMGTANVAKGDSQLLNFSYMRLDEDGDPVEGVIYINSAVAITLEGFAGNKAIKEFTPILGYNPFDYRNYSANDYELASYMIPSPQLRITLSFDMDGESRMVTTWDPYLYRWDDNDENTVIDINIAQFTMDATFPYIYSVNGEESITLDENGGTQDVELTAYWYNIQWLVENYDEEEEMGYLLSAPEWLDVEIGEADPQTGVTIMTVSAEATDTPRSGVITLDGMGATYSLKVQQGESGVATISLEKGAEYYDLMGRKVANPEKGIFIKKHGKTSTKVIF